MVVLVDTSVWIELLGQAKRRKIVSDQLSRLVTCPIIIQEVLQGIRDEKKRTRIRESLLALPLFGSPTPLELFIQASEIYSMGKQKGFTIRSSIDCLIAATALQRNVVVWHDDRDFEAIARFTSLKTWQGATLDGLL